jgi:glucose-1-phosphate adenylyltransferase
MEPNLVILAGGISSRMKRPDEARSAIDPALVREAEEKTKGMIGVGTGHRPFLDYLLYNVERAGYRDVTIVVGERDSSIQEYYGAAERGNAFHRLVISYATQPIPDGRVKPLGTADALWHALRARADWAGTRFTVCNSDNLYSVDALRRLKDSPHPCAMIDYDRAALDFERDRIAQFAVIRKDGERFLCDIVEKPDHEMIASVAERDGRVGVSMNIFRFSYDLIYGYLERTPFHPVRMEKELPTSIMMMLADHPHAMMTYPVAEHVPDLTRQSDIIRVQEYIQREFGSARLWE